MFTVHQASSSRISHKCGRIIQGFISAHPAFSLYLKYLALAKLPHPLVTLLDHKATEDGHLEHENISKIILLVPTWVEF